MPEVKKLSLKRTAKKKVLNRTVSRKKKILSREKFIPSSNFHDYVKVLYGDIGVGKTTLALQQENSYALMFDQNDSFECFQDLVGSWEDMIDLVEQLVAGNHNYSNVIIDGLHIAYEMALDHACKVFDFEHPGNQNDYGASWNKVKKTFISPIRQLLNSSYGLTFICHSVEKDIETKSGRKFIIMQPNLPSQAIDCIIKPYPNVFYYTMEGHKRFLQIEGDDYITAKNRMEGHFLTTEGERVFKIPMGNSSQEAYRNLVKAYNNQQTEAYRPQKKAGVVSPVKKGGLKKIARKIK